MELEILVEKHRAQFGFQEGIMIEQGTLRVAALILSDIKYHVDLSKAYDTVFKLLLLYKMKKLITDNLLR